MTSLNIVFGCLVWLLVNAIVSTNITSWEEFYHSPASNNCDTCTWKGFCITTLLQITVIYGKSFVSQPFFNKTVIHGKNIFITALLQIHPIHSVHCSGLVAFVDDNAFGDAIPWKIIGKYIGMRSNLLFISLVAIFDFMVGKDISLWFWTFER